MRDVLIIFAILLVLLLLISALGGSVRFSEKFVQVEEEEAIRSSQDFPLLHEAPYGAAEEPSLKFDSKSNVQDFETPKFVTPEISKVLGTPQLPTLPQPPAQAAASTSSTEVVEPFDGTFAYAAI